jgi:regulator of ribosome biosynthesis
LIRGGKGGGTGSDDLFDLADDFDPVKEARDKRKARVGKNEKQRLANQARAQGPHGPLTPAVSKDERKGQLRSVALQTKMSTASMGKWVRGVTPLPYVAINSDLVYRFDKKLDGEPKLRGIKRKVRRVTSIWQTIQLNYPTV